MLLAAGLGVRMMPLTKNTPKALIKIGETTLLDITLNKLKEAHFSEVIINTSKFHSQFEEVTRNNKYGLDIRLSYEGNEPLETAGGIRHAITLLGKEKFLVINTDIYTDFNYATLHDISLKDKLAHLILVKNPDHNQNGDFGLQNNEVRSRLNANKSGINSYTFSGISVLNPQLITKSTETKLGVLFNQNIDAISAEVHKGIWMDIGTPQRLNALLNCWSAK